MNIVISRKNLKSIKKLHIYNGIKKYKNIKQDENLIILMAIVLYDIFQKNNEYSRKDIYQHEK